ncbi:hypothetical protein ACQP3L_39685, partial [Escherichia coli]
QIIIDYFFNLLSKTYIHVQKYPYSISQSIHLFVPSKSQDNYKSVKFIGANIIAISVWINMQLVDYE